MTPAETLYRFLLRLYPEEHRQAYGKQMQQHARDLELAARERGRPYVAALYLRLIGDGIVNAGKEQWTVMRAASFKPVPWYAVLLAAIPGLWLVLVRRHPEPLAPLLPAIRNISLVLLAAALAIVWRRTRQVPVWALVPLGMLAWELVYLLGWALTSAAGQPGGGLAMVAIVVIVNLVLAGVLFAVMLHGRRLPTAAVVVIVLMMLSSLPLLAQLNQSDFWNGRPFYWYLIPMLWGPSQALMLVAAGLLAARRYNVLALLVVIGGYGYRFLDADDLGVSSMRYWPGLSLYLVGMTFLFFLLAPVAFLRAKTRLGRALALFLPASIFLAARLAVPALVLGQLAPALVLGQLTRILPGDALISSDILLGLILGWILYSHLGNAAHKAIPGVSVEASPERRLQRDDVEGRDSAMPNSKENTQQYLPLTPAVFHILLALASGEKHGYAIMREVERSTAGRVSMGPGTLYGAIKRLLKAGLIAETAERPDPTLDDARRRYYQLSALGQEVLAAETERLALMVNSARAKNVLGTTS